MELIITILQFIADSAVDVLPIAVFLFAFQRLVIGGPLPNWKQIVVGFLFVVVELERPELADSRLSRRRFSSGWTDCFTRESCR